MRSADASASMSRSSRQARSHQQGAAVGYFRSRLLLALPRELRTRIQAAVEHGLPVGQARPKSLLELARIRGFVVGKSCFAIFLDSKVIDIEYVRTARQCKTHLYWSVVENKRLDGGRVVQRHALYLGEINSSQAKTWRKAVEVFDAETGGSQTLALFPEDRWRLYGRTPPSMASPRSLLATPTASSRPVLTAKDQARLVRHGRDHFGPHQAGTKLFPIDQQPWLQGFLAVSLSDGYFNYGLKTATATILTGPGIVDASNIEATLAGAKAGYR
jgi:hypothetical protein